MSESDYPFDEWNDDDEELPEVSPEIMSIENGGNFYSNHDGGLEVHNVNEDDEWIWTDSPCDLNR